VSAHKDWANQLPIILMSAEWIAPLFIFWFRVWGPLRPFHVAPVDAPPWPAFLAGLLLSVAMWWLPDGWYRIRAFERSGRAYERLGVRGFRRFVTDCDLVNRARRRGDTAFRMVRGRVSFPMLAAYTRQAERGHMPWLVAGLFSSYWAARAGFATDTRA
jgi:hypothetical protein